MKNHLHNFHFLHCLVVEYLFTLHYTQISKIKKKVEKIFEMMYLLLNDFS